MNDVLEFRAGAEQQIVPGTPARFGLVYSTSPTDKDRASTLFTAGVGFMLRQLHIDFGLEFGEMNYASDDLFPQALYGETNREERDKVETAVFRGMISLGLGAITGVEPLVTVGLPIYNAEAYLAECIESIKAQTLKEFVVLAVLDCPTDNSAEVLRRHADSRFQIIENPTNIGLAATCNRMLNMCETDLLAQNGCGRHYASRAAQTAAI